MVMDLVTDITAENEKCVAIAELREKDTSIPDPDAFKIELDIFFITHNTYRCLSAIGINVEKMFIDVADKGISAFYPYLNMIPTDLYPFLVDELFKLGLDNRWDMGILKNATVKKSEVLNYNVDDCSIDQYVLHMDNCLIVVTDKIDRETFIKTYKMVNKSNIDKTNVLNMLKYVK